MESYIAAKMDEPYTSVQTKLTNIRLCGKKKKGSRRIHAV